MRLGRVVFTIAVGMIDINGLRAIRAESRGEFDLAVSTAAAVVAIGVEQGIVLAIALSLLRHVRHSYRPNTIVLVPAEGSNWEPAAATPGTETGPGLIIYRLARISSTRTIIASPTRFELWSSMRHTLFAGSSSTQARSRIWIILPGIPFSNC